MWIKTVLHKTKWILGGGYKPEQFWDKWSKTFMDDLWQVETHPQHMWLFSEVNKEKPKSILEVGCGFGRNIKFLREKGISATITGVDISQGMIHKAKKYVKNKNTTFVQGDILKLPFKDKSFDVVFTHGVLMHVPSADVNQALSELSRVARKSVCIIEQNYGGNEYTFIHPYRKILKSLKMKPTVIRSDKKLGLDQIKISI